MAYLKKSAGKVGKFFSVLKLLPSVNLKCNIPFEYDYQNLMEKRNKLARATREHQASDDTWAVETSDTLAQTQAHTQNSKTVGNHRSLLRWWRGRWGGGCDWMKGLALRGLRALGCAFHFISCAKGWWALYSPLAQLLLPLSGESAAVLHCCYHHCMSMSSQVWLIHTAWSESQYQRSWCWDSNSQAGPAKSKAPNNKLNDNYKDYFLQYGGSNTKDITYKLEKSVQEGYVSIATTFFHVHPWHQDLSPLP